jgi:hypothetical protein
MTAEIPPATFVLMGIKFMYSTPLEPCFDPKLMEALGMDSAVCSFFPLPDIP